MLTPISHVESDSASRPIDAHLALKASYQSLYQHSDRPVVTNPYPALNHYLTYPHPSKRMEKPRRCDKKINHAATPLQRGKGEATIQIPW